MPSPPNSSAQSANDPSVGTNRPADLELAADQAEPLAPASDSAGGSSSSNQADPPQQPDGSFGQSRQATHNLLRALGHDLQASAILARTTTKAAAFYLRTKLKASIRPESPSTVRSLGKWIATALIKAESGIRGLRTKPLEKQPHTSPNAGWWEQSFELWQI